MTRAKLSTILLSTHLVCLGLPPLAAQPTLESLGLAGKPITCMAMYESMIVVGTNGEGVYYQFVENLPDSEWVSLGLAGEKVNAVYPHKGVGPEGAGPVAVGVVE